MVEYIFKETEIGLIPEDWEVKSLPDVISNTVDNRGKSAPLSNEGIMLIATNCIKEIGLYPTYDKIRFVSKETYDTWFRDHPKPNDIIIVNKGTPGLVCLVPDPVDFCIAQDMVAIRANKSEIYNKFLFAYLRSPIFKYQVDSLNVGTTIPHLKKTWFSKLFIPIPSVSEQKFIGDIYYNLSKKIHLNQKMNKTLEAIGQTIFRHWFVHFEFPDENNQPYKSSGGEMVDSELGEIPIGWNMERLKDHCYAIRGFSNKYVKKSNIINLNQKVNRGEFLDKSNFKFYPEDSKIPNDKFARKKDILLNSDGEGTIGRTHLFWENSKNIVIDQHITIIRPNQKNILSEYLYYYLIAPKTKYRLENEITGSTGMVMLNISKIRDFPVIIPKINIQNKFSRIASIIQFKKYYNVKQSENLSRIRDSLLPKLISGKIRVPMEATAK